MFGFLKKLFGGTPAETTQPEAAPYKVDAPAPSQVTEKASEAAVKSVAKPAAKKTAPKKKAAPSTAPKQTNRPKKTKTK
jgi:hypothetical protein